MHEGIADRLTKQLTVADTYTERSRLLVGDEVMERFARKKVIVFGIGGVGSWCAESLVRSGVKRLTIVDYDKVAQSNINRQAMATHSTVGEHKVYTLRQRLLDIALEAYVNLIRRYLYI